MKRELYNYQFNKKYSLNKINIYAYSFFDTKILVKGEEFNIDIDSIISNISSSVDVNNHNLNEIREKNHENYYKIDTKFLTDADIRYKKITDQILSEYKQINSSDLLTEKIDAALSHQQLISHILKEIELLKEQIKEDLLVIIDYVDRDEKQLDLSFLDDDNNQANALKKKYNTILLHKSIFRLNNLNLEMERQKNRLTLIRQLIPLTKRYALKRKDYLTEQYNENNTKQLKENLSLIISDYIFLLSSQEFHELRGVIQGILDNDYTYIFEFLYTYRLIIDKIWKYSLSDIDTYQFDFCYLVCNSDIILKSSTIEVMNRKNMYSFMNTGYICKLNGSFCDIFGIDDSTLINIKLPNQIDNRCKFDVVDESKVEIIARYNMGEEKVIDSKYPLVDIS